MITFCLTDFLSEYPAVTVISHNLGGNMPFEIERMDHRALVDRPGEELPSSRVREAPILVDCNSFGPRGVEMAVAVYGAAAKPMRQWFDLLHEQVREKKVHFTCYPDVTPGYLSDDVLKKGDALFDEAEKLAAGDESAAKYVAKSRLWLRYPEIMRSKPSAAEVKKFADDCRKFGIAAISEGGSLDAWEKELPALNWNRPGAGAQTKEEN